MRYIFLITANTSLETHIPPPLATPIPFHDIQDNKGMTNGLKNAAAIQVCNDYFLLSILLHTKL